MQRLDSEFILITQNLSKLTTECRSLDEKIHNFNSQNQSISVRQSAEHDHLSLQIEQMIQL